MPIESHPLMGGIPYDYGHSHGCAHGHGYDSAYDHDLDYKLMTNSHHDHHPMRPLQETLDRHSFLRIDHFLSEFATPEGRALVKRHLGIKDVTEWGDIQGNIKNQADLWSLLRNMVTLEYLEDCHYVSWGKLQETLTLALEDYVTNEDFNAKTESIEKTISEFCTIENIQQIIESYFTFPDPGIDPDDPDNPDNPEQPTNPLFEYIKQIFNQYIQGKNYDKDIKDIKEEIAKLKAALQGGGGSLPVTPIYQVSLNVSPSSAYYGQEIVNPTWSYSVTENSPYTDDAIITCNGEETTELSGEGTYEGTIDSTTTILNLKVKGTLPDYSGSVSISFSYKNFYFISSSSDASFSNLKDFSNNQIVNITDSEQYIYLLLRHSDINTLGIRYAGSSEYDGGTFTDLGEYDLPEGSFVNQTKAVSGYHLFRTNNPLAGNWQIKY